MPNLPPDAEPRGPRFFDPSLDASDAWPPPRPPDDEAVDPGAAAIDLAAKLATFDEFWKPKIVGRLNDYQIVVVKARGEFVWHTHDATDELFLVLHGSVTIQLRDRDVVLTEGQLFVVPRGVEHRPRADEEAHLLLVEPVETVNTGDATGSELTARPEEI